MARKRKTRRARLSQEEKAFKQEQRKFRAKVKSVFDAAGFIHIATRSEDVHFLGHRCEFDFIFVLDNLLVIAEDTCSKSSEKTHAHLLKKNLLYEHLYKNKEEFVSFLTDRFPQFAVTVKAEHQPADFKLCIAYCSKSRLEDRHKAPFKHLRFMEDRHIHYFSALAKTLGRTMRFELFKFLGVKADDIALAAGFPSKSYEGFILPESPSGFPSGYKVVTFYVDPDTIMPLSYVLRKDSWMDGDGLYQRMISRSKIRSMRQYLAQDERVFINNVIVSLPPTTKVLDQVSKKQLDVREIKKTTPVNIEIPIRFDSVGIIDGQHRVFAYHEGTDPFEQHIAPKRKKQQLLVTGIVYPGVLSEVQQREFEAKLFLEINDKQTRTRADLRQTIEAIVNPFSVIAISRSIITNLAADGPLCGFLEEHQFDSGKLKSSSLVSYGLRHIVKCDSNDTLFRLWKHADKDIFAQAVQSASSGKRKFLTPSKSVLDEYITFCSQHINHMLVGYKMAIPPDLWTLEKKKSRALTTTAINGLIFCLRRLLELDKVKTLDEYKKAFPKLTLDFSPKNFRYRSSHWKELGDRIVKDCFS